MKVSGWGNFPVIDADIRVLRNFRDAKACMLGGRSLIARGLGRSYGDSSLNSHIISILGLNRMLSFEEREGIVSCEAGVSLEELLEVFVPRGWFLPVTPGTKFVTVGGAISSDVHGKNHHKDGTFSSHVISFDLMLPNGDVITCSPTRNADFFRAACGGMGLLGFILRATIQLRKIETSYIRTRIHKAKSLNVIMDLFEQNRGFTYSVAWIDCLAKGENLGRSILLMGEHAPVEMVKDLKIYGDPLFSKSSKKMSVRFNFPNFLLNNLTVKGFNCLYYGKNFKDTDEAIIDYDAFFYPLDAINHWNRIYGSRGFTQYQCVLPKDASRQGLRKILTAISNRGLGSFLAVLKLFGKGNDSLLSFPMEGYTLALDFPIKKGLFDFLTELDGIVLDYGGRLFLAKDVRMKKDMFMKGYTHAEEFIQFKHNIDKENRLQSLQSQRLGI